MESNEPNSFPQEELLARHLPALRVFVQLRMGGLLRAQESESDLVQSVCRELLENADRLEYRGEGQFRNWLYAAAMNKIREHARHYRAAKRDVARVQSFPQREELLSHAFGAVLSPSHEAMAAETREAFERAFQELPEHYQEVILLSRVVGLSQEETATEMDRTVASVRNLLSRALAQFAALVDQG